MIRILLLTFVFLDLSTAYGNATPDALCRAADGAYYAVHEFLDNKISIIKFSPSGDIDRDWREGVPMVLIPSEGQEITISHGAVESETSLVLLGSVERKGGGTAMLLRVDLENDLSEIIEYGTRATEGMIEMPTFVLSNEKAIFVVSQIFNEGSLTTAKITKLDKQTLTKTGSRVIDVKSELGERAKLSRMPFATINDLEEIQLTFMLESREGQIEAAAVMYSSELEFVAAVKPLPIGRDHWIQSVASFKRADGSMAWGFTSYAEGEGAAGRFKSSTGVDMIVNEINGAPRIFSSGNGGFTFFASSNLPGVMGESATVARNAEQDVNFFESFRIPSACLSTRVEL